MKILKFYILIKKKKTKRQHKNKSHQFFACDHWRPLAGAKNQIEICAVVAELWGLQVLKENDTPIHAEMGHEVL